MRFATFLLAAGLLLLSAAPFAAADSSEAGATDSSVGTASGCWVYDPTHNPQMYYADPCPSPPAG